MEKTKIITSVLICIVLLLTILYPLGAFLFNLLGYSFAIKGGPAFALVLALLCVCLVVLCFKAKPHSKLPQIIIAALLPLSLINSLYLRSGGVVTIGLLAIYVSACGILVIKHIRLLAIKATSLTLSLLLAIPVGIILFFALIFGSFGKNTVVKTVRSPSGEYYAQVIDSDQGALGGDTLVEVYEKCLVDNSLIRIQKEPRRIYSGEWGEYEHMQIYWKSDACLVINGIEHQIE